MGFSLFQSCKGTKVVVSPNSVPEFSNSGPLNPLRRAEFEKNFFEGQKEKMLGNYVRAQVFFIQALKNDPKSGVANYEVGQMYFNRADLKNAEVYIETASKLEPKNKWYKILLADIYSNQKKYDKAVLVYEELTDMFPNEVDYYEAQASYYKALRKPNEALKVYEKMELQFGVTDDIIQDKKKLLITMGKYEQAVLEIQKVLKINPRDKNYLRELGNIYFLSGNKEKAFETYSKIDSLYPNDGYAQFGKAEYYLNKGDKKTAIQYLKSSFESNEISVDNKIQIVIEMFLKSSKDSMDFKYGEELTKIIERVHENDVRPLLILGEFYFNQKRYLEAKGKYEIYICKDPKESSVWLQLISTNIQLQDYKEVEKVGNKGLELFPTNPSFYFYIGLAQMELKKYQDALNSFSTGLDYTHANNSLEVLFLTNMAEAHQRVGKVNESYKSYEEALKIEPKNAMVLNNYAFLLAQKNLKIDKAEEMSKKSLEIEPNNESFLDTYGWILYLKGSYVEAEKYVKKALIASPTNSEVLEHYGDILFKLNKIGEAVIYWQQAQQLGSENQDLTRKIAEKKL